MARLALHVSSDLGGLKMLEKEIERTKKAIIDLYGAGNSSAAKSMEAYLHRLMKQHSQLYESLKPVIYQYQQLERAGVSSLGNLGRAAEGSASGFDRLRNSLAGLAAGFSLSRFIGEVVNVRGEIQQLGIAFETMLGSKSDAEKMMSDIAEFAQKTPFTLTEVANNTKQLMAMGIASENVMDTMKALGDVAAGLSVPISRLAVNYGQVATLGKLQSREIRDFAMAGVPVLDELARMLGKSKDEISAMSEAGQIGFPLVEQAFKNMSSEGGKFYNMMENQNASVTGQISKLKDQIQAMMNEIGSSGEGAIYGAVNLSSELVKNYKQVGETIAALTAVWGTYRVALMATTAVESARAAVLEKQLTDESLQNVSRSNLTRGTMAYTAALKTEFIAQQQRELSVLKQIGYEQRRNYVQLQSQLVTAQQAIIDAKANGVKEKRIRQLQREASAISVRIQAARADMIATAKSITAKQAEIAANTGNVASTNLLTVAKNRLALATRRLTAAMMNNPYTVAAVAVVALGYGIYKLVTHMTDAEKAQKRLIDLNSEYTKSLASEQVQIRVLFDRIKSAKEGTEEYERAKKGIMSLADSYQAGLSSEIDLVNDLAGAYDKVSGAAQNAAKSRAIEKGTREAADTYADEWNENITSIRGMFIEKFGEAGGEAILQDLKYSLESGGAFSEELKKAIAEFNTRIQRQQGLSTNAVFTDYNPVDEYIERIRKSKEILDDEIKEINSIYKIGEKPAEESGSDAEKQFIDVAKEIENAKKKVADFKQEIEDLRSGKTQVEAGQNLTETINNKLNALKEAEDKLAVLTGKQGKPPKPPKSNEQEYLEAEQKLANEQVELRLKTGKRILDAMDESFAKRKLKIESEYRKEEQEVKEEGEKLLRLLQKQETEKWIKGGSKGTAPVVESLPPEMQADVDAGYEAVREKRRAEEERLRLDMEQMAEEERLRFADALLKQLSDIEGYYRERIRQAEGNETLIATLIQSKERELGAARSEYAREMLANEQEIVKSRIAASTGYYRLDADRREAELTAEKENTEERIRLMEEQYRNAPTEELGKDIELARIELDKFNRELSKMPAEKASELSGYFSKIAGALGGLDGEMGEVFSEMSNAFGSISEVMKSDMSSMEGKMGAYAAAIEGAVQLINLAVSAAKRRDAVEKEFYKNQIALAHEYALAINEQIRTQSEISGSGFIKDYAGEIKDGFDALTDATGKYQEALSKLADGKAKVDLRNAVDWGQVGKGAATGAAAGAAIGSVIPAIGTAVGAVVGGLVGGIVGLFGGKKKEAVNDSLLAVFPELVDAAGNLNRELAQTLISTDQVDENTKQLLQNAIDWADAVEEANGKINDLTVELAGDLGGNIKNALMEAFKAGEDASKRMFKAAGDSLGKFVEDILYSTVFSEVFKQFGEELAASLNPATGDQDVLDDYDRLMDNLDKRDELYLSLLETIKKRAQDRGFDLWEDDSGSSNENTLKGASAKASQESIDLMSGQMGAVRRTLELILASLNRVMTIRQDLIDSVMGGLNAVPELIASGLHELIAIRELNARIAASNDAIASNTHSIGEIAGRVAVIGVTVAGNRESLQLLRGDTAAIGAIAEDTKAAANSLHNMERSVNVNLSGL